jgi:hypothetical protein
MRFYVAVVQAWHQLYLCNFIRFNGLVVMISVSHDVHRRSPVRSWIEPLLVLLRNLFDLVTNSLKHCETMLAKFVEKHCQPVVRSHVISYEKQKGPDWELNPGPLPYCINRLEDTQRKNHATRPSGQLQVSVFGCEYHIGHLNVNLLMALCFMDSRANLNYYRSPGGTAWSQVIILLL